MTPRTMFQSMLLSLLSALLWSTLSSQQEVAKSQVCYFGCDASFADVTFNTTVPTDDYYTGFCQDTFRWQSVYLCIQEHCSPREIRDGLKYYRADCQKYAHMDPPSYDDTIREFPSEKFQRLRVIEYKEVQPTDPMFNETLRAGPTLFRYAYKSWQIWVHQVTDHHIYSWTMTGYWALVLLIGMTHRLIAFIMSRKAVQRLANPESASSFPPPRKGVYAKLRRLVRTHLILPATFGYRHQRSWYICSLPTRIQSLTVFAFIALNVVSCAVDYQAYDRNMFWSTNALQLWRYIADRTGIIAMASYPLIWLFAGRNDIFLWLTGWSFSTFQVFHKWVARVVTVEVILHSIGYTVTTLMQGGRASLAEEYKEQYWYCGVIATICLSFLWLFSFRPIRQAVYDLFLYLHIGLAIMTLVTTYYHIRIFDGVYEPYIWPAVALWSFDRAVRLLRLAVLNYKVAIRKHTPVIAEYDKEKDVIRLSITPSFHLKPSPGTYYFLHFPVLRGIGNHPFTLSGWTLPGSATNTTRVGSKDVSSSAGIMSDKNKEISPAVQFSQAEVSSTSSASKPDDSQLKLHFIIRPYKGLTSHLRNFILKSSASAPSESRPVKQLTALVEGPYGESHPLHAYPHVLFFAGGSGISASLPYIQQIFTDAYESSRLKDSSRPVPATRSVHLVWAAREGAFVDEVLQHELRPSILQQAASCGIDVRLSLHITRGSPKITSEKALSLDGMTNSELDSTPRNGSGRVGSSSPNGPEGAATIRISMHAVRPDVEAIIEQEVATCLSGRLVIFTCGPGEMADQTRRKAVNVVGSGNDGVAYYEEEFGW